jgi:hypothetical protein
VSLGGGARVDLNVDLGKVDPIPELHAGMRRLDPV